MFSKIQLFSVFAFLLIGSSAFSATISDSLVMYNLQRNLLVSGFRAPQLITNAILLLDSQAEQGLTDKGFTQTGTRNDGTRVYSLGNPIESGLGQVVIFRATGDVGLVTYSAGFAQIIHLDKSGTILKNQIKAARWGSDFSE